MPDAATRIEVPKSGCIATNKVGAIIKAKAMIVLPKLGGNCRLPKKVATINGTDNFISSDGWKRNSPKSNQRCAPLLVVPIKSTKISKIIPTKYKYGANF